MPWKVDTVMDQRIEFVSRRLRGERLTDLCAEFGISEKTGKKFMTRYRDEGARGLHDQSRRPHSSPRRTAEAVTTLLVEARRAHPTWGPHKLKAMLERQHSAKLPAPSTIGDILKRHGLVEPRKRRRCAPPRPTHLREATAPNDIWCIDYKGQFRMGKGGHCYPLTMTDQHTRFLLGCEAFSRISADDAQAACTEVFRRYGLPVVLRSDNGAPFASTGLAGLSTLSVWWLRLGIELERIDPASRSRMVVTSGCIAHSNVRRHDRQGSTYFSSKSDSTASSTNSIDGGRTKRSLCAIRPTCTCHRHGLFPNSSATLSIRPTTMRYSYIAAVTSTPVAAHIR